MNRGGGWSGGRGGGGGQGGGQGSGQGGQGGGPRGRGNNRGAVVRFPSDHVNRRDNRAAGQPPRFPSDSTKPVDNQTPVGPRGRDDRRPGGREGQGGQPRDNSSRDPYARERAQARENRNVGIRDNRPPRRDNRPRDRQIRQAPRLPDLALPAELDCPVEAGATARIDPFELFCAFHLGITPQDGYKAATLIEVARRFNVAPSVARQALFDFGLDPNTFASSTFDLAMAQMDIQVSPPGVSKTELARGLYEEYVAAPRMEPELEDAFEDEPVDADETMDEQDGALASAGE